MKSDKAYVKQIAAEEGINLPPEMLDSATWFHSALTKLCAGEDLRMGAELSRDEVAGVLWALRKAAEAGL